MTTEIRSGRGVGRSAACPALSAIFHEIRLCHKKRAAFAARTCKDGVERVLRQARIRAPGLVGPKCSSDRSAMIERHGGMRPCQQQYAHAASWPGFSRPLSASNSGGLHVLLNKSDTAIWSPLLVVAGDKKVSSLALPCSTNTSLRASRPATPTARSGNPKEAISAFYADAR